MVLLSIKLEKSNFLLAWLTLLLIYCRDQTKPSGESATGGAATHLCLRTEIFRPTLAIHSHLLSPCEENSIIWKRDWPLTWNICFRVVFLIQTSGFSGGDDGRTFSQVLSRIRGYDYPTLISTYIKDVVRICWCQSKDTSQKSVNTGAGIRVRMTTAARRRLMRDFKRLQVIIIFNEVHLDAVSKIIVISSSTTVVQFPALIGGPSGWGVRSSRGEQHYVVERGDLWSPRDSLWGWHLQVDPRVQRGVP